MSALKVKYFGTNVGKIYLSDVYKRHQLGGAPEGQYNAGQDEYIIWGETVVLQYTGEVLFSMASGILKFFSTLASSPAFTHNGPPLVLEDGSFTAANEDPRRDIGDTGAGRYTDAYMSKLADARWGTGLAGATGYYYGND